MGDFSEIWGSVEALRSAVAAGYVKPGREEKATLALAAEIDRLRKDAERYRWLRTAGAWESEIGMEELCQHPERFDAAVDAAMTAAPAVGSV